MISKYILKSTCTREAHPSNHCVAAQHQHLIKTENVPQMSCIFFITAEPAFTCCSISDWNQRSYLWSPSVLKKIQERDSNMPNLASNIRYVPSIEMSFSYGIKCCELGKKCTLSAILCYCSYSVEFKWLFSVVHCCLSPTGWCVKPQNIQSSSYIQPCTYCQWQSLIPNQS